MNGFGIREIECYVERFSFDAGVGAVVRFCVFCQLLVILAAFSCVFHGSGVCFFSAVL
jgi:hypothetical protein